MTFIPNNVADQELTDYLLSNKDGLYLCFINDIENFYDELEQVSPVTIEYARKEFKAMLLGLIRIELYAAFPNSLEDVLAIANDRYLVELLGRDFFNFDIIAKEHIKLYGGRVGHKRGI